MTKLCVIKSLERNLEISRKGLNKLVAEQKTLCIAFRYTTSMRLKIS